MPITIILVILIIVGINAKVVLASSGGAVGGGGARGSSGGGGSKIYFYRQIEAPANLPPFPCTDGLPPTVPPAPPTSDGNLLLHPFCWANVPPVTAPYIIYKMKKGSSDKLIALNPSLSMLGVTPGPKFYVIGLRGGGGMPTALGGIFWSVPGI